MECRVSLSLLFLLAFFMQPSVYAGEEYISAAELPKSEYIPLLYDIASNLSEITFACGHGLESLCKGTLYALQATLSFTNQHPVIVGGIALSAYIVWLKIKKQKGQTYCTLEEVPAYYVCPHCGYVAGNQPYVVL